MCKAFVMLPLMSASQAHVAHALLFLRVTNGGEALMSGISPEACLLT